MNFNRQRKKSISRLSTNAPRPSLSQNNSLGFEPIITPAEYRRIFLQNDTLAKENSKLKQTLKQLRDAKIAKDRELLFDTKEVLVHTKSKLQKLDDDFEALKKHTTRILTEASKLTVVLDKNKVEEEDVSVMNSSSHSLSICEIASDCALGSALDTTFIAPFIDMKADKLIARKELQIKEFKTSAMSAVEIDKENLPPSNPKIIESKAPTKPKTNINKFALNSSVAHFKPSASKRRQSWSLAFTKQTTQQKPSNTIPKKFSIYDFDPAKEDSTSVPRKFFKNIRR